VHLTQQGGYSFRTLNTQVCLSEKCRSKNEEEEEEEEKEEEEERLKYTKFSFVLSPCRN
jgi:hypothetical protein